MRKWEKKKKIYEYVWYKNKIKWTPRFQGFSNYVQSDNEDFLCASRSLFAICTCPPISSVCIFLFPLLDLTLFSNDLFDESR
jgi:hypothetical protein